MNKRKNKKNINKREIEKRASILPDFSVKTIILIMGFVILLIVVLYIGYKELIKDTTCEDSVVIRHGINLGFTPVDKIAPLTCTTKKLCLTQSGEGCEVFNMYDKDDYLFNRRIKTQEVSEARAQIIDKLAEEMYNCQNLFTDDEGEPYYFMPRNWLISGDDGSHVKYCLICTRVVLDNEARKNIGYVTYGELYQRLSDKKTQDGRSYLEFFYPGWEDWRRASDIYSMFKAQNPDRIPQNFEDWKIDLSDERGVAIVSQIAVKSYLNQIATSAGVLLGTALVATYVGAPFGITLIGTGVASGLSFWYSTPDDKYIYSPPTIYQGDIDTLKSLGCDAFESSP
jgi:hypothetical protein